MMMSELRVGASPAALGILLIVLHCKTDHTVMSVSLSMNAYSRLLWNKLCPACTQLNVSWKLELIAAGVTVPNVTSGGS